MEQTHKEKVKSYWTHIANEWDDLYESKTSLGRWFNRVFRKAIFMRVEEALKACLDNSCKTVLDIGCGSGRPACVMAKSAVEQITGIDVATSMIGLANKLAQENGLADKCQFMVADFSETSYEKTFDAVIALGVLDYVDDSVAFLTKMRTSAKKIIFFSAPKPTLVRSPLRKIRYTFRKCPITFYTRAKLDKVMKGAGFHRFDIKPLTGAGYMVIGYCD
ncbi:MAG: class I SAM-dependent methyltransferase [Phycisphaerae bacterium]|nr:class I SAM-dependent methyltransferase [Phycisphaerae bacterium]